MSADNWAVCPRCRKREEARIADLQRRATEAYGQLPVDEFDALRAEAAKGIDLQKLCTFREDYEIWGADDGTVRVNYSGECQACGLDLHFEHEHPMDLAS